jgi:hypothetical protein
MKWSEDFSLVSVCASPWSCFLILLVGSFSFAMPFAMIVWFCIPARPVAPQIPLCSVKYSAP